MKNHIANVIDLELNDWKIIEIGLTTVDLKKKSIVKTYSIPILPSVFMPLTPEIEELTGWTDKKLAKSGIYFSAALDRLQNKYGSKGRLTIVDTDNEINAFKTNIFKTMSSTLSLYDEIDEIMPFGEDHINVSTLFKIKTGIFENLSLIKMLKHYKIEFEGKHHRADADSYNIAKLFLELIK